MSMFPKPEVTKSSDRAVSPESQQIELQRKLAAWMGDHPIVVIGAGVIVGAVLGWYVKQKK